MEIYVGLCGTFLTGNARNAVDGVGGAIDGVDDKGRLVGQRVAALIRSRLLANKLVGRKVLPQAAGVVGQWLAAKVLRTMGNTRYPKIRASHSLSVSVTRSMLATFYK